MMFSLLMTTLQAQDFAGQLKIDSLLVHSQFAEVRETLASISADLEAGSASAGDLEHFRKVRDVHMQTMARILGLATSSGQRVQNLIDQGRQISEQYDPEVAGDKAFDMYQQFLRQAGSGRTVEAVRYYFLAHHFRTIRLISLRKHIEDSLLLAEQLYKEKEYDKGLDTLAGIRDLVLDWPGFREYASRYDFLRKDLQRGSIAEMQNEALLGGKERADYAVSISAGLHIRMSEGIGGTVWYLNRGMRVAYPWTVTAIDGAFGIGPSMEVVANLTNPFQAGVDVEYGTFEDNRISVVEWKRTMGHSIQLFAAHVFGQFRLRSRVGLMPYGRIGIGIVSRQRKEKQISELVFFPGFATSPRYEERFYTLEKKTETGPQLLLRVGTEYIPGANSRLVYGLFLSYTRSFEATDFAGNSFFSSGVKMGVLF
jgi:hypothetical protein